MADRSADKAVSLHLADDLPSLPLDAVRLRLLLRNLLDNAVRHGGGAGIDVSTWREADALLLRVRDHGPGVPIELIPRLAETFFALTRPAPALLAVSAWACTCAGWWRTRTAAACTLPTPSRAWR